MATKTSSNGESLPPLEFTPTKLPPLIPEPEVYELFGADGWRMFLAALRMQERME